MEEFKFSYFSLVPEHPNTIFTSSLSRLEYAMNNTIISFSHVDLSLQSNAGTIHVLKNISLGINRGEATGLVGPSGSGKSSVLMLMAGLELASKGTVTVLGNNLSNMNENSLAELRRSYFGIVFQSFHLIPNMTALENVATPLELSGERDAMALAKAELSYVGLAERSDHYPSQLSGGEQQRVALARAAVVKPEVLLADEPTGNLDVANGLVIMDLLFDLREKYGSTLLLVTHDPALADRCDKVIYLSDGRIVD